MMISPECFLESHKDKPYVDLLALRDELLEDIRTFEKHSYNLEPNMIHPSQEEVYQCNLQYLGKLCELIAEKYNKEYVWGDVDNAAYLEIIRDYLVSRGLVYNTALTEEIRKRKAGKKYTIRDHIRGMIYSLLTNQRKWYLVEPHLPEIDQIFCNYNSEMLLETDPIFFVRNCSISNAGI